MKEHLSRIKELRDKILYIEMEIEVTQCDLISVIDDLIYLSALKNDLEYNIQLHKRKNIISVASEYKKSILQLDRVNEKILSLNSLKSKLNYKLDKRLESREYYNEEFDKVYKQIEEEPVILMFKKKKKKKKTNEK